MADAGSRPEAAAEHHDVLIVGAGLSGIGAAHHLKTDSPGRSFLILESRECMGGTWDLFRYPGIRSDSDMYTLGYSFRPWTDRKAIADGPSILRYIQDTARDGGIEPHIRYAHHVTRASWSSETARWTVDAEHAGQTVASPATGCTCAVAIMITRRAIRRTSRAWPTIAAGWCTHNSGRTISTIRAAGSP
jgi:cation diffusion facilitator CzcD-associated flavoprotein CzcO